MYNCPICKDDPYDGWVCNRCHLKKIRQAQAEAYENVAKIIEESPVMFDLQRCIRALNHLVTKIRELKGGEKQCSQKNA